MREVPPHEHQGLPMGLCRFTWTDESGKLNFCCGFEWNHFPLPAPRPADEPRRPTLDELREQVKKGLFGHDIPSRFKKTPCKVCKKLVTNQAQGRAAHTRMHERKKK